jgi:hypothetical protein
MRWPSWQPRAQCLERVPQVPWSGSLWFSATKNKNIRTKRQRQRRTDTDTDTRTRPFLSLSGGLVLMRMASNFCESSVLPTGILVSLIQHLRQQSSGQNKANTLTLHSFITLTHGAGGEALLEGLLPIVVAEEVRTARHPREAFDFRPALRALGEKKTLTYSNNKKELERLPDERKPCCSTDRP